jgi:hypothetical protein
MKTFKLFLFLESFVLLRFLSAENTELVVEAIKGVLTHHYAPFEPKIDLLFNGPKSEILAEKLLQQKPYDISVRVFRLDTVRAVQTDFPSILLFDSVEYFLGVVIKIKFWNERGIWFNHLIFSPNYGKIDIIEYLNSSNTAVENLNFIKIVNDSTVDLVSSSRFSPGMCNKIHYNAINQFSANTLKWHNKTFFPDKYENFHGCQLKVAYQLDTTTSTSRATFEILAQHLNFQYGRVMVWFKDLIKQLTNMTWLNFYRFKTLSLIFIMNCSLTT